MTLRRATCLPVSLLKYAILLGLACTPEQVGCEQPTDEAETETSAPEVEPGPPPVELRGDGTDIQYTIRFPDPHAHYFEVEAVYPASGDELTLMMAVWTPGSYLVREFARHVEDVTATALDDTPLGILKIAKNRWKVMAGEGDLPAQVVVRYRVYARELSVRTNFVDDDIAILNGAATFLAPLDGREAPTDVRIELPEGWPRCVTGLEPVSAEEPTRYASTGYDQLVDSPIVCGDPHVERFETEGVPHELATFGGAHLFDHERAARDVQRIVEAQQRFWGIVPYGRYVFENVLLGGGGGLEHTNSTLIMGDSWVTRDDTDYRRWLSLVSHEFFHTWNVKRLRPQSLGPFDYEREVLVRDLWIVEGVTSYYDDLMVRRAGLMTQDEYLSVISHNIQRLQDTPGRLVQSLDQASFDAWIKFYRPDENSRNSRVSYYLKGALVAWLLDAEIRARTGTKSLDDVMREAYTRFPHDTGYTPEEFRDLVTEVVGEDMSEFFATNIDNAHELEWDGVLGEFGLRFRPLEEDPDDEPEAWMGVEVDTEHGRMVVQHVPRDTPAHAAGVNVGDELLAMDDERIPLDLSSRVARYRPGEQVDLLISRRGRLRRLPFTFGTKPVDQWHLERDPTATPVQRRALEAWLGPDSADDAE